MKENRIKMSRKAAVCIVLAIAAALFLIVVLAGIQRNAASGKVESAEDAAEYLLGLGWEVDQNAVTIQTTVLPEYFDNTISAYNKLQLEQGFDLTEQAGQEITVDLFPVTNYPNASGDVLACLMTCKGKVIGGDIHSSELDGFMHALK